MIDLGKVSSKVAVLFDSPTDVYRDYLMEKVNRFIDEELAKEKATFEELLCKSL